MEPDRYHEQGTIFREGDSVDTLGASVRVAVNKAMADHKRLLESPLKTSRWAPEGFAKQDFPGRRETLLQDGTRIVTTVSPYGLVPMLIAQVYTPELEVVVEGVYLAIGFYHIGDGPDAYLYETDYLLARLPLLAPLLDEEEKMLAKPPIQPIDTACSWTPDHYSGLMRLWVQAKRAENLEVPGVTYPRTTGLVRSANGIYWFVYRDGVAGTLTAKKGMIDPSYGTTLDDYLTEAQTVEFSQFKRQLAEAQYLVGLIPTAGVGTVILTDSRLKHTNAEQSGPSSQTQWLSWTSQRRDRTDENAPAVRWLKLDWKDDYWSPFPIVSQPNPVNMLTCRVDFSFPDDNTITATLTEEASDEISWVWEGYVGTVPVGSWEWPIATWYDADGEIQEIRRGQNTASGVTTDGTCRSSTYPPSWWEPVPPPPTNPWEILGSGTCNRVITQGSYWFTFLGTTLTTTISDATTVETLYPPHWELDPVISGLYHNFNVPAVDYSEWVQIGGNILWRQLRSDAAFFVQRDNRENYYHYEQRYIAWDVAPWPAQQIYWSVPATNELEVLAGASALAVAGNEIFQMTEEHARHYVDYLDTIGTNPAGIFYTPSGWLAAENLWLQYTQPGDPDMEWIRISYDGQKIVRDGAWNPISLSTDNIVTHPFLVDCAEKSIWVGAA